MAVVRPEESADLLREVSRGVGVGDGDGDGERHLGCLHRDDVLETPPEFPAGDARGVVSGDRSCSNRTIISQRVPRI